MSEETSTEKRVAKPKWLRVKLPVGKKYTELRGLVDKYKLNTICASGSCPNMGECWGEGTATFMILGKYLYAFLWFLWRQNRQAGNRGMGRA